MPNAIEASLCRPASRGFMAGEMAVRMTLAQKRHTPMLGHVAFLIP